MALTESQRQHWRRRWAEEAGSLARRRRQLRTLAAEIATALLGQWPGLRIWLFGSVLGPGFHPDSDLDLAVEGLPANALLEALSLADAHAAAAAERLPHAPVTVDVVRLESLPPPWQARIRREGHSLP